MPTVNASSFGPMPQFVNLIGEPAAGDKLFFYQAGTNTKLDTYTDSTGSVANTNPIILDALGNPPYEIWWAAGSLYKMVWAPSTDTDPPVSAYRTIDNLRGMNDFQTTAVTFDEWLVYGAAATYISGTSFSVTGNQTNTFQIGRRVKTTNTGGTVYSTITNSVFGAVTTVTVRNDSGVIDSGLSAVAYGVLSVTNPSIPVIPTPSFSAYRNAALTLVSGALTALVCDTEENDIGGNFASGIFTCPSGGNGEYQFNARAEFQNIAGGQPAFVTLYKNVTRHKDGELVILDPASNVSSAASAKISLVAGDTVQPYIFQQSGSTIGISNGNVYATYFQGILIAKT